MTVSVDWGGWGGMVQGGGATMTGEVNTKWGREADGELSCPLSCLSLYVRAGSGVCTVFVCVCVYSSHDKQLHHAQAILWLEIKKHNKIYSSLASTI